MTYGPARTPNPRQDHLNEEMRASMYDDGVLDVFVDVNGDMRRAGMHINEYNQQHIMEALTYFDEITGIPIRFVDSEAASELSIHKLNTDPGMGFETWGQPWNVKGLVHAKGGQDTNLYFEGSEVSLDYTKHIIFHEMAHIFGAYELAEPYSYTSDQTIMAYGFNGFHGYTESDTNFFDSIY